jgi:hypothetical protein
VLLGVATIREPFGRSWLAPVLDLLLFQSTIITGLELRRLPWQGIFNKRLLLNTSPFVGRVVALELHHLSWLEVSMSAGRIIAYISAAILIFFGVLFIWATFSPEGQIGWLVVGVISVGIGFGLIWFASRKRQAGETAGENLTLNIDLSGDVNLDTMKCKSCGGAITMDNIKMVAGAPVVTCPYCNTTYQLTEEPKW